MLINKFAFMLGVCLVTCCPAVFSAANIEVTQSLPVFDPYLNTPEESRKLLSQVIDEVYRDAQRSDKIVNFARIRDVIGTAGKVLMHAYAEQKREELSEAEKLAFTNAALSLEIGTQVLSKFFDELIGSNEIPSTLFKQVIATKDFYIYLDRVPHGSTAQQTLVERSCEFAWEAAHLVRKAYRSKVSIEAYRTRLETEAFGRAKQWLLSSLAPTESTIPVGQVKPKNIDPNLRNLAYRLHLLESERIAFIICQDVLENGLEENKRLLADHLADGMGESLLTKSVLNDRGNRKHHAYLNGIVKEAVQKLENETKTRFDSNQTCLINYFVISMENMEVPIGVEDIELSSLANSTLGGADILLRKLGITVGRKADQMNFKTRKDLANLTGTYSSIGEQFSNELKYISFLKHAGLSLSDMEDPSFDDERWRLKFSEEVKNLEEETDRLDREQYYANIDNDPDFDNETVKQPSKSTKKKTPSLHSKATRTSKPIETSHAWWQIETKRQINLTGQIGQLPQFVANLNKRAFARNLKLHPRVAFWLKMRNLSELADLAKRGEDDSKGNWQLPDYIDLDINERIFKWAAHLPYALLEIAESQDPLSGAYFERYSFDDSSDLVQGARFAVTMEIDGFPPVSGVVCISYKAIGKQKLIFHAYFEHKGTLARLLSAIPQDHVLQGSKNSPKDWVLVGECEFALNTAKQITLSYPAEGQRPKVVFTVHHL